MECCRGTGDVTIGIIAGISIGIIMFRELEDVADVVQFDEVMERWSLHRGGGILLEDHLRVKGNDFGRDSQAKEAKTGIIIPEGDSWRTQLVDVVNQGSPGPCHPWLFP